MADYHVRVGFGCSDADEFERGIAAGVEATGVGELIVLPTDTVYGIGADAFSPPAVRRLLAAKGRGRNMPPPVLVSAPSTMRALAVDVPAWASRMLEALWPGSLTVVCYQQPSLTWDLGEARGTVAVRLPAAECSPALLKRTGPLTVSSANTSGASAAEDGDEAESMFGDEGSVDLDGGSTAGSSPSTILGITSTTPRVLRDGGVELET